jgi:acylphosphatase
VQGVGFRWRAIHAANFHSFTGWCRNEWDGSVLMEIQGEESNIDEVLSAIEAGRYILIEEMDVKTVPLIEGERGFNSE